MKLEVVTIPVSDVDRAKEFYESLGWRLDADFTPAGDRVVQFTPPGSACSIHFGTDLTSAAPGSAQGLFLIVSDIQAARDELVRRGVEVSEVFHFGGCEPRRPRRTVERARARPAQLRLLRRRSAIRTATAGCCRRSRRGCPAGSTRPRRRSRPASDLASALRRAEAAHGEHEKRTGQRDANWPDWYAAYMVAEQAGTELASVRGLCHGSKAGTSLR